jgi:hypothetical protein
MAPFEREAGGKKKKSPVAYSLLLQLSSCSGGGDTLQGSHLSSEEIRSSLMSLHPQAEWREEVKLHFEKIKSEGTCLHRLEEELVMRRREELRCVPIW